MNEALAAAHYWKDRGIATIPISYRSKMPKVRWLTYTGQLPTDNELENWYAFDSNIAVVAGWNDLVIIDFDDVSEYLKWQLWCGRTGGLPLRVMLQSRLTQSARGAHIYVYCKGVSNMKLPKIDILAERKYALIPPSVHPSGARYQVIHDTEPIRIDHLSQILPQALLNLASREAGKAADPVKGTVMPHDQQNANLRPSDASFDPYDIAAAGEDPHLVERIKERFRIEDFFPEAEDSSPDGRWKMTRCPFHDDHNPSFYIDTEQQICGCHSGCTPLPLDVIGLYARLHGIDNRTAILEMAENL